MTTLLREIAAYLAFWDVVRGSYDPVEVEALEQAWALPSPPSRNYRGIRVISEANLVERYRRKGLL